MAEKRSKADNMMLDSFRGTITIDGKVLKILGKPLPPYKRSGEGFSGVMLASEDGTMLHCHECGRMFKNVGIHSARKHGVYEKEYKDKHELFRGIPVVAPETRKVIGTPANFARARKCESPQQKKSRLAKMVAKRKLSPHGSTKNASRNLYETCDVQIPKRIQREAEKQGVEISLLSSTVPTDQTLVSAAFRHSGSWNKAKMDASGKVATECDGRRLWNNQEKAISAFRAYYAIHQEYPFYSDLGEHTGLPPSCALKQLFGSYSLNAIKIKLGWPVNLRGHRRKA